MSTFSFTYDPFTQLTMVEDNGGTTNDSLEYGGARQRVFKKTTVSAGQNIVVGGGLSPMLSGPTITTMLYIHGGNDYPIMEKISTGEDKMYVYGPTGLIAMRDNSTWYDVHKDHLGSVRVLATSSGTASSSYDYDVYGKIGRSSVNVDITYKFTGQEFDGETGLYNFRARLYDNTVGVFYAVDPAHENFSQYGYVGGNPVSFVDPTGRVTAYSPLIADMIEEGYASFHTPGDPFGNQGGGGGFVDASGSSDWSSSYVDDFANAWGEGWKKALTHAIVTTGSQDVRYLLAAIVGEGSTLYSVNEMAQIAYVILNRSFDLETSIEDVVTDPGQVKGIETSIAKYVLTGEIDFSQGQAKTDLKHLGEENTYERYDDKIIAGWDAVEGVVSGDIPNLIGSDRYWGSYHDFLTSKYAPFPEAREYQSERIITSPGGSFSFNHPDFSILKINGTVFFDDPSIILHNP